MRSESCWKIVIIDGPQRMMLPDRHRTREDAAGVAIRLTSPGERWAGKSYELIFVDPQWPAIKR